MHRPTSLILSTFYPTFIIETILPILDYPGVMIFSCNKGDKVHLQTLQNEILRRILDRVSTDILHEKCRIIILEQRRRNLLLSMMYSLSKDEQFLQVDRLTRSVKKIVLKVPN